MMKWWNHFKNVFMKILHFPACEAGLHLIVSGNNITWGELYDTSLCKFHQSGRWLDLLERKTVSIIIQTNTHKYLPETSQNGSRMKP
jgi:hypothetical protein